MDVSWTFSKHFPILLAQIKTMINALQCQISTLEEYIKFVQEDNLTLTSRIWSQVVKTMG